jgi:hypothetical protein
MLKTADTIYAWRFLRLLTMPWTKTGAYKAGIIDKDGNTIKKPETSSEKKVYNIFHRLVFNIRRLLAKIPLGRSTIARYGAALYLIKEHTGLDEKTLGAILEKEIGWNPMSHTNENVDYDRDVIYGFTAEGEILDTTTLSENIISAEQVGTSFGEPVFKYKNSYFTFNSKTNMKNEDAPSMSAGVVAGKQPPMRNMPPLTRSLNWKLFDVSPDTFRKFSTGRKKFERWKKYLNLDDQYESEIYQYAKSKPKNTIVLRCSETGALRAIRRKSSCGI